MFKTGVITASWVYEINQYRHAPWGELLDMHWARFGPDELDGLLGRIAGMGFEWVELWIGHTGNLCTAAPWRGRTPGDIVALCDKHGLKLASFCPGGIGKDADALPLFEFARGLGVNMLTGWLGPQREAWEKVDGLLAQFGMRYGIEPHGPVYSVATPEQMLEAHAFSARFGSCPDTGVLVHEGIDAVEGVRQVAKETIHTHIKGWHRGENRNCAPGDDDIGLDQVVRLLRDTGYDGVYSLEYEVDHNPDAELARSRAWLLRTLAS